MHLPTQRHAAEAEGPGPCRWTTWGQRFQRGLQPAHESRGQTGLGKGHAWAGSCNYLQRRFQTEEMRPEHHRPDGQDSDLAGCQVGTTAGMEKNHFCWQEEPRYLSAVTSLISHHVERREEINQADLVHAGREMMSSTCTHGHATGMSDGGFWTQPTNLKIKHNRCSGWHEACFFFFFKSIPIVENADWLVWCMQSHKRQKTRRSSSGSTHERSQCAATAGMRPPRDWRESRPGKNTSDLTPQTYSINLLYEARFLRLYSRAFPSIISGIYFFFVEWKYRNIAWE